MTLDEYLEQEGIAEELEEIARTEILRWDGLPWYKKVFEIIYKWIVT